MVDPRVVAVADIAAGVLHQGGGGPRDVQAALLPPASAIAGLLFELDAVEVVPLDRGPDVLPDGVRVSPDVSRHPSEEPGS